MKVSGEGSAEKEKTPKSYIYLSFFRTGFFFILSYVYFCSDEGSGVWMKAYIITTLAVLAVNGVLYHFVLNRKALLVLVLVDIMAATPYGYVISRWKQP